MNFKRKETEILHNGIELGSEWPPRNIDFQSPEPPSVPYLEKPPAVIPIPIGRQLFVDDFLIETTTLIRQFHYPIKYDGNPILIPETPLEMHLPGQSVAGPKSGGMWWDWDEKLFKFWYEAGWLNTICYATSKDGLHWDRPTLDILSGTNQVLPEGIKPDSWSVVRDYWCSNPAERYKLFMRGPDGGKKGALCFVSSDGIHWEQKLESGSTGDRSTLFYNPFRHKWIFSLRGYANGRRVRQYIEADDFLKGAQWQEGEPVAWTAADKFDQPDAEIGDEPQLYNLDAVAYESLMLGFFQIHLGPSNDDCVKQGSPKITELKFAYSRDGFHWSRPDRNAAIRAERSDVWDKGYIQPLGNLCTLHHDKLWFYYIGFQGSSKQTRMAAGDNDLFWNGMYDRASTGVAFLRRDGFASMTAGAHTGTLTTRTLTFNGRYLFVNLDAPHGLLKVEILDAAGVCILPFSIQNCVPLSGDSTLMQVRWNKNDDLSALRNQPIKLRFELTAGQLYSFWVSCEKSGCSGGYVAGGGPGFVGQTDTVGNQENI